MRWLYDHPVGWCVLGVVVLGGMYAATELTHMVAAAEWDMISTGMSYETYLMLHDMASDTSVSDGWRIDAARIVSDITT